MIDWTTINVEEMERAIERARQQDEEARWVKEHAHRNEKTYVDNYMNRRLCRVGKPLGSQPHSGSKDTKEGRIEKLRGDDTENEKTYVDNYMNRRFGRVGKPLGSQPHSRSKDTKEGRIEKLRGDDTEETRTETRTQRSSNFREELNAGSGSAKVTYGSDSTIDWEDESLATVMPMPPASRFMSPVSWSLPVLGATPHTGPVEPNNETHTGQEWSALMQTTQGGPLPAHRPHTQPTHHSHRTHQMSNPQTQQYTPMNHQSHYPPALRHVQTVSRTPHQLLNHPTSTGTIQSLHGYPQTPFHHQLNIVMMPVYHNTKVPQMHTTQLQGHPVQAVIPVIPENSAAPVQTANGQQMLTQPEPQNYGYMQQIISQPQWYHPSMGQVMHMPPANQFMTPVSWPMSVMDGTSQPGPVDQNIETHTGQEGFTLMQTARGGPLPARRPHIQHAHHSHPTHQLSHPQTQQYTPMNPQSRHPPALRHVHTVSPTPQQLLNHPTSSGTIQSPQGYPQTTFHHQPNLVMMPVHHNTTGQVQYPRMHTTQLQGHPVPVQTARGGPLPARRPHIQHAHHSHPTHQLSHPQTQQYTPMNPQSRHPPALRHVHTVSPTPQQLLNHPTSSGTIQSPQGYPQTTFHHQPNLVMMPVHHNTTGQVQYPRMHTTQLQGHPVPGLSPVHAQSQIIQPLLQGVQALTGSYSYVGHPSSQMQQYSQQLPVQASAAQGRQGPGALQKESAQTYSCPERSPGDGISQGTMLRPGMFPGPSSSTQMSSDQHYVSQELSQVKSSDVEQVHSSQHILTMGKKRTRHKTEQEETLGKGTSTGSKELVTQLQTASTSAVLPGDEADPQQGDEKRPRFDDKE